MAALTVPYAERVDQSHRKSIPKVTEALRAAARTLSARMGGSHESRKVPQDTTTLERDRGERSHRSGATPGLSGMRFPGLE